MCDGMRTENDVDVIDVGKQSLTVALGDTTAYGNHALARGRRRQAFTGIALTVQARIGGLAHAARHKDDNISMLGIERHKAAI